MKSQIMRIVSLIIVLTLTLVLAACRYNNESPDSNGNNISYVLSGGTMNTNINSYDPNVGISEEEMPIPMKPGYVFAGWYTTSHYAEDSIVRDIPIGTHGNYHLYAKWELENYEITYVNVPNVNDPTSPNNTNPTSYNIEKTLTLEIPEWSGLIFTHWTDSEGNIYNPQNNITTFPKGMSGDIVLTANWKVTRNVATPADPDSQLFTAYVSEDGFLYFFYDLGTIEHVVLDETYNDTQLYYKTADISKTLTLSKTVTISEESAKSISNTVSKSISSTISWEDSINWAHTHTTFWNAQIGAGAEGGIGGQDGLKNKSLDALGLTAKLHIEGFYNWGSEDSTTDGWTHSDGGNTEETEGKENTITSSIAYKTEITSSINETYEISADLPNGYYAYVHAGNIRVIAVVTYETATGNLYLNTYTRLDNMHAMPIYYPNVNQLNNPKIEGLDFTIPSNGVIESFIENAYYVKYDANGGEGEMLSTMHTVDGTERLATNTFTKPGYSFVGWVLSDDTKEIYQDGQSVTNIGAALQTVTLKALWRPNVYSVSYNSNSGMGSMENSTHTYDETSNLNSNAFYKTGYQFIGWNTKLDGSGTSYNDGQETINLTQIEETITLYAQWKANTYTVKYHANGGSGSMASINCTYDKKVTLTANSFHRHGWTFNGWSMSTSGGVTYVDQESIINLSSELNGIVNLYAVWTLKTSYSDGLTMDSVINQTGDNERDIAGCSWNTEKAWAISELINEGYKTFTIKVSYTVELHGDPTQVGFLIGTDAGGLSENTDYKKDWSLNNVSSVPSTTVLKDNWYTSTKNDTEAKKDELTYVDEITKLQGKYLNLWFEAYRYQFLDGDDYYKAKGFTFSIEFHK